MREAVAVAFGDATGLVFLIRAAISVLSVVAALLLEPITLRSRLDTTDDPPPVVVAEAPVALPPEVDRTRSVAGEAAEQR